MPFPVLSDVFVIKIWIPHHFLSTWLSNRFRSYVALSRFSEWDPLWHFKQWPEFLEVGRVLVLEVVDGSTFEDGDIISTIVDDVAVSASSNWDPASFSKQWLEFFEGGLVLSWKTVRCNGYNMYNCNLELRASWYTAWMCFYVELIRKISDVDGSQYLLKRMIDKFQEHV